MGVGAGHSLTATWRSRCSAGRLPELCDGCGLLPGDGTAFGATARLFVVPFVGPARLGDVADGVPPLLDGPVVPLELDPEEPDVPPLVWATTGDAASKTINEQAKTGYF